MRIAEVSHHRNNFEIRLEDGRILDLQPDIYLQFSLQEGKELSESDIRHIEVENKKKLCLKSAFNILSRRIHSEYELKIKLIKKHREQNIADYAVSECIRLNLLNDENFAEKYIKELKFKGKGKYKIIAALTGKGIKKDIIDRYIETLADENEEHQRALEIAKKKIRAYDKDIPANKVREKLYRHLQSRGYSFDAIKKVIDELIS